MSTPSLALSNLRGFVVVVVLAFHSVLAYLRYAPASPMPFNDPPYQWRSFPILDSARWFGFDLFCALQDIYLISLMFFLSGLFVRQSLVRTGTRGFLRARLSRLGLPFVLTVAFLMPLAHYPVYRVTAVDPTLIAFWQHWLALPFWPSGPPWFLWVLLVLDFTAAALFTFAPGSRELLVWLGARPARLIVALLSASALTYVPMALMFTPWQWLQIGPFAFQLSRPLHYAVYFFAGVAVGTHGIERGLLATDGWLVRRWAAALAVTTILFVAWLGSAGLAMVSDGPAAIAIQILAALSFVLCCGAGTLCALALVVRFANRRVHAFEILHQAAYGIYLVHYVFVIWLQYLLLGAPMLAIVKGTMVFAGTFVLSLATVAAIGCIPAAARIIGAVRRAAAPASRWTAASVDRMGNPG